ncbi:MAG: RNA polymerase sigma factor [Kofleriaceae bacterium]
MTEETLESLVARAAQGSASALDTVARRIKDDIYGLAIRMLWHPADAEDATQEILIRVIANLGTFEGRSSFRTWVYRVAVRALLNLKRGRAEAPLSFEAFGEDLLDGLQPGAPAELSPVEQRLLSHEIKLACTQAMLLCLDRDHRMAYVLGEILELSGEEAAECLDISAAAYRKRLSRARERVHEFTRSHCGLVDDRAPCRCDGRIAAARLSGRIDPERLLFASHPVTDASRGEVRAVVEMLGTLKEPGALLRSNPRFEAPDRVLETIRRVTE